MYMHLYSIYSFEYVIVNIILPYLIIEFTINGTSSELYIGVYIRVEWVPACLPLLAAIYQEQNCSNMDIYIYIT